ncbi:hypothetical protein [Streptomyces sp. enrichment culture]|uniref:hypothetical protein n=1 Tax=Streptomyces sp. enrichment culture TaxID=1795815 RepID=UPI003F56D901
MNGSEADRHRAVSSARERADTLLEDVLSATYEDLGTAVCDRITAQGGPPELCEPDLALDRLLASAHRQMGVAIVKRISAVTMERKGSPSSLSERNSPHRDLRDRPAELRLRHRQKVLTLGRLFRTPDMQQALRSALMSLEELHDLLEHREGRESAAGLMSKVIYRLGAMPSQHVSPASTRADDGYEDAVKACLDAPARRLAHRLHDIRRLTFEDLASYLPKHGNRVLESLGGATEVVQDLRHDVERALDEAVVLEDAIEAVMSASNDFCGADLQSATLEGISLRGVIWNLDTVWPVGWEDCIRRSSLPRNEAETELVIAAEPCARSMHADV